MVLDYSLSFGKNEIVNHNLKFHLHSNELKDSTPQGSITLMKGNITSGNFFLVFLIVSWTPPTASVWLDLHGKKARVACWLAPSIQPILPPKVVTMVSSAAQSSCAFGKQMKVNHRSWKC